MCIHISRQNEASFRERTGALRKMLKSMAEFGKAGLELCPCLRRRKYFFFVFDSLSLSSFCWSVFVTAPHPIPGSDEAGVCTASHDVTLKIL